MKKAEKTMSLEAWMGLFIGVLITLGLLVLISQYKCTLISCELPCIDDQAKGALDSLVYQILDSQATNTNDFSSSILLTGDNCALVGFFLAGSTGDIEIPSDVTTQLKSDISFLCICELDSTKNKCTENKYCSWVSNINAITMNDNGNPFLRKGKDAFLKEFKVSVAQGLLNIYDTKVDLTLLDDIDYGNREISPGITYNEYLLGKEPGNGDLNKDGVLDLGDIEVINKIITGTFSGYTIDTYPEADLNGDGKIDFGDKTLLSSLLSESKQINSVKIQKTYSYEELVKTFGEPTFNKNKNDKDLFVTKYYIACEQDHSSWSAFAKDVKIQGSGFSNENKLCRYSTVAYGKDRCYSIDQTKPLKIGAGGRPISPFRTLAGHPDDFGKTVYLYYSENNPYNGCYVIEDTGGQNYFRWEGNQLDKPWQSNPKGWKYKKLDLFAGKCKSELQNSYQLAPSAYPKIWVVNCEPEPLRLWHSDNSIYKEGKKIEEVPYYQELSTSIQTSSVSSSEISPSGTWRGMQVTKGFITPKYGTRSQEKTPVSISKEGGPPYFINYIESDKTKGKKAIVLTFDQDLRGLNMNLVNFFIKEKVHATFFVTEIWAKNTPDGFNLLNKYSNLFEIGSHSKTHGFSYTKINGITCGDKTQNHGMSGQDQSIFWGKTGATLEQTKCEWDDSVNYLKSNGANVKTCRLPVAQPWTMDAANALGLVRHVTSSCPVYIQYSIWPPEGTKASVTAYSDAVLNFAKSNPDKVIIVLSHAYTDTWNTDEGVQDLYEKATAQGYEFLTISEALEKYSG